MSASMVLSPEAGLHSAWYGFGQRRSSKLTVKWFGFRPVVSSRSPAALSTPTATSVSSYGGAVPWALGDAATIGESWSGVDVIDSLRFAATRECVARVRSRHDNQWHLAAEAPGSRAA